MIGNLPTVRSSALNFGMDCRMGCVQWYFCLGTRPKLGPSHPVVLVPWKFDCSLGTELPSIAIQRWCRGL